MQLFGWLCYAISNLAAAHSVVYVIRLERAVKRTRLGKLWAMRDAFSQLIPIAESEMDGIVLKSGGATPNHVSNGYYGFQPVAEKNEGREAICERMDTQDYDNGIQFNNYIEKEPEELVTRDRGHLNRKRHWDCQVGEPDFKKRRECGKNVLFHSLP